VGGKGHASRRRIGALAALLLLAGACGYRFETVRGGARFGDPAARYLLAPFANLTSDEGAGAILAGNLREELRREGLAGSFTALPADFLVEGTVREVGEEIVSHDDSGYGQEYRLTLQVDVRVVETATGRLLWKEEGISETAPYYALRDFSFTRANRHRAIEEACRRLALRMSRTLRTIL
jgi:hypothetical protein